ncbi:hypothetical protein BC477_10275 [Clavibacter michiganensis subsp. michiganensis]|uniref:Uncharacterized protein n=1 Tax=Clavibacter michiganensis subsp. michiganensis TaxID=33013 RepID=A0A251XNN0_CLAMM|nr:hypothetical protein BC477_10275 [Clavibacter michiganensis subsp. michiganensis]OUE05114.1 hypothetical protein CMMCAS07_09195 [Clavibacter michiganensis subsp. michiganensis]
MRSSAPSGAVRRSSASASARSLSDPPPRRRRAGRSRRRARRRDRRRWRPAARRSWVRGWDRSERPRPAARRRGRVRVRRPTARRPARTGRPSPAQAQAQAPAPAPAPAPAQHPDDPRSARRRQAWRRGGGRGSGRRSSRRGSGCPRHRGGTCRGGRGGERRRSRLRVDVELAERLRLDLIRGVVDDLRVLVRPVVPERRQLDRVVVGGCRRGGILDELGVDHRRVRGHDGQRRAILRVVDRLEDHLGGHVVALRGIRLDLAGHRFARAVRRGVGHVPGVGLAGELHVARVDGCVRDAGLGRRCVEVGVVIVGVLVGIDLVERGDARVVLVGSSGTMPARMSASGGCGASAGAGSTPASSCSAASCSAGTGSRPAGRPQPMGASGCAGRSRSASVAGRTANGSSSS